MRQSQLNPRVWLKPLAAGAFAAAAAGVLLGGYLRLGPSDPLAAHAPQMRFAGATYLGPDLRQRLRQDLGLPAIAGRGAEPAA